MTNQGAVCPLDNSHNACNLFWEFEANREIYKLYKCESCDLLFYDPFPNIDYNTHTDSISSLKDYVHLNANIEGLIFNLLNNIPEGNYKSILEVGCGFGYTLDFARRILNMEVVGYEPSLYGKIGSEELGIDIRRTYLTRDDVKDKKYDIIFLSEVIEHIQDPVSFLSLLKEGLSEKGILILTTPDHKKLTKNLNIPHELAMLSPEAHVILFSPTSMHKLLAQVGFEYTNIISPGTSLVAVASVTKIVPQQHEDRIRLVREYYQSLIDNVKPGSLTYTGIIYRLFRSYVDRGNYEQAAKLMNDYPFPIMPSLHEVMQIDSERALNNGVANCASMLSYCLGFMKLNYYQDFAEAAVNFEISFILCEKRLRFVPNASVMEFELVWLSRYHQALSLSYRRKYEEALTILKSIINFQPVEGKRHLPLPSENLRKQCENEIQTIIQKI